MASAAPRAVVKLLGKSPYEQHALARAGPESRTALLGTRTAPCDAILKEFVARKANVNNIVIKSFVQNCYLFCPNFIF